MATAVGFGAVTLSGGAANATISQTVVASADAYVSSREPSANFGAEPNLRVDSAPNENSEARIVRGYVRFDIPGSWEPIVRATLRMYATNGDHSGFTVGGVSDSWDEQTITWSNAPPQSASQTIASGRFAAGDWVSVDVTPLVSGSGTVSFFLTSSTPSPMAFASRDQGEAVAPRLSIETAATTPVNQALPDISGTAQERQHLSAAAGTWSGTLPISYAYQWQRCDAAGGGCVELPSASTTTYTPTAADVGNTLRVVVTASNSAGSSSAASPPTPVVVAASDDTSPPSAPADLTATADQSSITLSWKASSDDVAVAGYSLFLNGSKLASTAATSYSFGALRCGTGYTLGVAAYDPAGNTSPTSALTSATAACSDTTSTPPDTNPPDIAPPTPPSNLQVGAADQSSITLSWSASSDDVAVAGYNLSLNGTNVASTGATSYSFGALSCGTSYTLGVAAYDAAGNRSPTSTLTSATASCSDTTPPETGPPTPPSSLQVGAADQSSIRLSWSAASDDVAVTGYNLFLNGEKVGSTAATSYSFTGLNCGASYTLGVQAYDAAANVSAQSSLVAATSPCLDTSAPLVPTGVTVTAASASSISALWNPSFDNVGVTGYDVFLNGSKIGSTPLTNYTFANLTCGSSYTLGVDAFDAAGNTSARTTVTAATSACPGGGGAGPSIKYRFAYSNRTDQNLMQQYGFNLIDVSTKSEADATPTGTQGQLWLYDYDNNKCSWEKDDTYVRNMVSSVANDSKVAGFYFSNEPDPFACPNAPQQHKDRHALIKSLAPTKYTLIGLDTNWREHFDNYGTMWKGTADYVNYNPYICYVGKTCDFAWEDHVLQVAETLGQPYFVTLQAFKEGTEWRWPTAAEESQMLDRLKDPALSHLSGYMTFSWDWQNDPLLNHPDVLNAIKDFNLGTSSSPGDTAAPTAPSGMTTTATTGTSVTISWTASTDNVGVTGYHVYRDGTLVSTTTGTSSTIGGLTCGTSYTFSVDAYDAAGNSSSQTSIVAATGSCGDNSAPTTPTNLKSTGATTSSVSFSWRASSDNVGVAGYGVYRAGTRVDTTTATNYTMSGLSCGTSYSIGVDAYDAAGNRSQQATLTIATSPCPDALAPTTPGTLTVTAATQTSISARWSPSFDNVGVTGYEVFLNDSKIGSTPLTSYTFSGLACGTNYTLGIEGYDAAGNHSPQASVVTATSACPDMQAPSPPSNLTKTGTSGTSVSLSWSASTDNVGVVGYGVYRDGSKLGSTASTSYTFEGLACGTTYTLGAAAYDAAGNHSAVASLNAATSACSSASDPVIAAAGDICSSPTDCAPTANLLDQLNPDAVLTLGDNAYEDGSLNQYLSEYDPNWGRQNAKVYPSPGNHEFHTANAQGYRDYFGARAPALWYSYDLGAWHVVSLAGDVGVSASAGSPQETWLRQDLAAHPSQCILAYWHEPRWSSGDVHGNDSGVAAFWSDLYAAGAEVILNGHDHNYQRFPPLNPSGQPETNGIREFVVGTGGVSHYGFTNSSPAPGVRNETDFGVLTLTLHPGSYDFQFVPVAGSTFTDAGSGTCASAAQASMRPSSIQSRFMAFARSWAKRIPGSESSLLDVLKPFNVFGLRTYLSQRHNSRRHAQPLGAGRSDVLAVPTLRTTLPPALVVDTKEGAGWIEHRVRGRNNDPYPPS